MKFLMNIKYIFAMTLIFSIDGCVSTVGDLPENYQFNSNGNNGLVFYSVACNIGGGIGRLDINSTSGNGIEAPFNSHLYVSYFNCNSPNQDLTKPEVKVLDLPAGWYEVEGYSVLLNRINFLVPQSIEQPVNYNKWYFKVTPGTIQYFGRSQLVAGYDNSFKISSSDALEEDLTVLQQHMPTVTTNSVINNSYNSNGFYK